MIKSRKKYTSFLLICVVVASLACGGCAVRNNKDYGNLLTFSYHYGSYDLGYWFYDICPSNQAASRDTLYLEATGHNGVELDVLAEIDPTVLNELSILMEQNDIYQWHGFHKSDSVVLDGYTFSLEAVFENGRVAASGNARYPHGYEQGHAALAAYFEALITDM